MGGKCVFKAKAWLIKLSCLTGNLIQVYLSLCRKGKYVMFILIHKLRNLKDKSMNYCLTFYVLGSSWCV